MDRKVIRHLAVVTTPLEKKKLEEESKRLEEIANADIEQYLQEQFNPKPEQPPVNPVPKTVATILGLIATAGLTVSAAIPPPWNNLVQLISFLLAGVAGLALKPPEWAAGKPVIQGALVTTLGTAVPVVASASTGLTGWWQLGAQALALVLAFLTGSAAPQLTKKEEPPQP